jgi:hypothetical protein
MGLILSDQKKRCKKYLSGGVRSEKHVSYTLGIVRHEGAVWLEKVGTLIGLMGMMGISVVCGCSDDDHKTKDLPFGDTAVVVVVNPVINDGNTVDVPVAYDETIVEGVAVDGVPGDDDISDPEGFAVLDALEVGDLEILFDGGPAVALVVAQQGDVMDLAVAYNGDAVEPFANFPIVYGVGADIVEFDTDADPTAVADALSTDSNIVFFEDGVYVGDLLVTGDNVIFFGEGFTERDVVIDGSVEVRGTGVRIRGFTITGDLDVHGNTFGMSFGVVYGNTAILGNSVSFLANHFCATVNVPSSSAALLHNYGLPPLGDPPAGVCP